MYEFFKNLIASEEPVRKKFNIVDPTAVGDDIRSVTVSYIPPTEDDPNAYLSLYWTDSQSKIFQKTSEDEAELRDLFSAMVSDLNTASDLTKDAKNEEASSIAKSLFKKYDVYSDKIVEPGYVQGSNSSSKKAGRVVQRDVFFESEEDYAQFLEKTKNKPTKKDKQVGDFTDDLPPVKEDKETPDSEKKPEISAPNLSREDYEQEQAKEQKSLTKRIEQEVEDHVESALEEKAAAVFEPADDKLIEAMRERGRTWEEIKDYYTKELKYEEEDINAYIDQKRAEEQGSPADQDKPKTPKPPENLVSPDTHDKLVDEVKEEPKKEEPIKDIIKESPEKETEEEIEKQDMSLAEIDNQGLEINKVSQEPLETVPKPHPGMDEDMHPKFDFSEVSNESLNEDDKAHTPADDNDDQDLGTTTTLNPGDNVYVMSDYDDPTGGYRATFVSDFKKDGEQYAVVDLGRNELKEVPYRNVKRASFENVHKRHLARLKRKAKAYEELKSVKASIERLKTSLLYHRVQRKVANKKKVITKANQKMVDKLQNVVFIIHESQTKGKAVDIYKLKKELEEAKKVVNPSSKEYIDRALQVIKYTKERAEIFDANALVALVESAIEFAREHDDYVNE